MFSCCRCVNPKSPKYNKKGSEDDDSSGEGNKDPCPGDNLSSEEEIKVEIIETEEKPVEAEPEVEIQPCDAVETIVTHGTDSSAEMVLEEQGDPPHSSSPETSPNKSSTSSEQQQQSVVQDVRFPAATEPACPVSSNSSTADVIPTTVAEVEKVGEITANETSPSKIKCEEDGAIVQQPKISSTSPVKSEPEPEGKSDHDSNGKA